MKKALIYLAAVLLLFGAVSGGAAAAEQAAPAAEAFSPDGSVIFERDGVKVTTAGLDTDPTSEGSEPIVWLDIENAGDEDAYLGVTAGSVNGYMTDIYLIDYYMEDGEYYGGDYTFDITLPAGGGRYGLGYNRQDIPGVDWDTLVEMELCFTMAEDEFTWPDYVSEPVTIAAEEASAPTDLDALGTVVIDDDTLGLVFGEQDYDDGPMVYVYVENKTDHFIGVMADTADADGNVCDYIFYSAFVAPGKRCAGPMSFDSPIRELKGFENLTVGLTLAHADTLDELYTQEGAALESVTVKYPPQVWGEYENGGMTLAIKPRINALVTVDTPENDEDGDLFTVSETASLEEGGFDGAGWLFSIRRVGEERLHELLCSDMSGTYVFAKDGEGAYYICDRPTDVRLARADDEEMESAMAQWAMLNRWAEGAPDGFAEENGLESAAYGNSAVNIYVAQAAWAEEAAYNLSTTEYGPLEANGVDVTPYADFILQSFFMEAEADETPDGEYISLSFPEEDVRLDFFSAPGGYVRTVSGDQEALYQAAWYDENESYAEVMRGWYYAIAEKAGLREADASLDSFVGAWSEKTAGRGAVTISRSLAPGKAKLEARWPDSAAVENTWEMTAVLDEKGRLVYENGVFTSNEYDEDGESAAVDERWDASGYFYLSDDGELCWHDDLSENDEDSVFVRATQNAD